MTTVAIKDKYAEILTALGGLQDAVNIALQRYTIEQITAKINELRRRDSMYHNQYGLDYPTFAQLIAEDDEFVRQVEANVSKTWEIDLADWEFCYEGIKDWTQKLQDILLT
ncbi:MAG: hypothetical protein ACE5PV_12030 [Candidatus Poribacteria bacterium]